MKPTQIKAGHHELALGARLYTARRVGHDWGPVWLLTCDDLLLARHSSMAACFESARTWAAAVASGWTECEASLPICGILYRCAYLLDDSEETGRRWIAPAPHGGWVRQPDGLMATELGGLL